MVHLLDRHGKSINGGTRAALAALPGDLALYTCAMGPASDQALLDSLASATDGRFYFMPTIDDLFEISNYIRGQVSGDAIVVNQSASASNSVMPAFVDARAEMATFTVAWADAKINAVIGDPKKPNQVSVRLRNPNGRLVPDHSTYLRRVVGEGYVVLQMDDPAPGQWRIEISTHEKTHVRYTTGVFVRSPLRLVLGVPLKVLERGSEFPVLAAMLDGKRPISSFVANGTISSPNVGLHDLLAKHRDKLKDIKTMKLPGGDSVPKPIGQLMALSQQIGSVDLFARSQSRLAFRPWKRGDHDVRLVDSHLHLDPGDPVMARMFAVPTSDTHTVTVRVRGMDTVTGTRFVRIDQASIYARS